MNNLPLRKQPFAQHLVELRTRFLWIFVAVCLGSVIGYQLSGKLITLLVLPLHKPLYYTSPMGGFNFVLELSLLVGILVALSVAVYHTLKFLEPILPHHVKQQLVPYLLGSVLFLLLGIPFAYFVSLPAALHFLGGFGTRDIHSLITAQEYYAFVTRYLVGFGIVFQVPLLLLLVNMIMPLSTKLLLRHQRLIIVACFILAAVFSPAVDPFNMTVMAIPLILLYYLSVLLVFGVNRTQTKHHVHNLHHSTHHHASRPWELYLVLIVFALIALFGAADLLL